MFALHLQEIYRNGQVGQISKRQKWEIRRGEFLGAETERRQLAEQLLDGEAEALTRKAIEMAKTGDGPALRLCLDRIVPPRRDRPVHFELPPMCEAKDAVGASAAIVGAVAMGELTPSEAAELSKIVESYTRVLQAAEFESRLAKLEKEVDHGRQHHR